MKKKLLSTLFAFVMVISLGAPMLAKPGELTSIQATGQDSTNVLARKKKHHRKKPKHPQVAHNAGVYVGTSSVQL